jgi:hypothetical protein
MLSPEDSREALSRLFHRHRIVDIERLGDALQTTSRMSIYRRLLVLGYVTSYSHTGRYYTPADVPQFDAEGLWQFQGVYFSRFGSVKATVEHLVQVSETGRTHEELALRLRVRVQNALLNLVRQHRIGRVPLGALYLYVSADPHVAASQVARRNGPPDVLPATRVADMSPTVVIEVLLEIIHGSRVVPAPDVVRAQLAARSITVAIEQVEDIFQTCGLKKKAGSRSPRSQR